MPPFCCIGIVCDFWISSHSATRSGLTVLSVTEYQFRCGDATAAGCAPIPALAVTPTTAAANDANITRFIDPPQAEMKERPSLASDQREWLHRAKCRFLPRSSRDVREVASLRLQPHSVKRFP